MTMNDEQRRIFDLAISLPVERRGEILDRECGGDAALRAAVEDLLRAAEPSEGLTAAPTLAAPAAPSPEKPERLTEAPTVAGPAAAAGEPAGQGPGASIGPYTLLKVIGEGGFGSVYLAAQEQPVRRQVALKIIKLGMDTKEVIARFDAERQALAMMDHPNIARVLDAGATATGRPYFVMDLVKGEPIAYYCDAHNLGIRERLELFAQVCAAVQHAHTKGIIHRDIKPSNVLVGVVDGRPSVKVIDFGIAKATSARLTEQTLFTQHRQLIGTLEYMSPEQAEGSLDIDTRTDVYSLGVLLYELLTGATPFDGRSLRSAAFAEIQRIIREVDPPAPSSRLSQSTDTLTTVAARRDTEPRKLGTIVRGELDWIVMKALEKDRGRRYETANGLAMDIRRYLDGEAVVAAPPSAAYRAGKFVRRHKGAVLSAAAVAAALLIGVVAFAWQASVARSQRDRAVKAEAETELRADQLQLVADFQADMLGQIDPNRAGEELTADVTAKLAAALAAADPPLPAAARDRQVAAFTSQWGRVNATDVARELIDRTILRPAIATIDTQFEDQPAVAARLRHVLAAQYRVLGLYDESMPLAEAALATRRQVLGQEHPDTLVSLNEMGFLLLAMGKPAEAEPCFREALEKMQGALGEDHRDTLTAMANLAWSLQDQGRLDEAEPFYRECLEKRRRAFGDDDPDTATAISNVGYVLLAQGKYAEAEPFFREAATTLAALRGEDDPDAVVAVNNLGYAIQYQGRPAEAEPFLREALERWRRSRGEDHPLTLLAMNNLALLLQDLNQLDEAERLLRAAMEGRRRVLGEDHPDTINSVGNFGRLLQAAGRLAEAEPYVRQALEQKRRVRGEDHPDTFTSINNYGTLLEAQGHYAQAEAYYREAMEKCRRVLGEEHPNTLITTINTGFVMQREGRVGDAAEMLAGVEESARTVFSGTYATWLAKLLTGLGRARTGLGEYTAAEANLLEAHQLNVSIRGEEHKETRGSAGALADLYAAWAKAAPGDGHEAQAAQWRAASRG